MFLRKLCLKIWPKPRTFYSVDYLSQSLLAMWPQSLFTFINYLLCNTIKVIHKLFFAVVLLLLTSKALYSFYVLLLTHIPEVPCLVNNLSYISDLPIVLKKKMQANSQPSWLDINLERLKTMKVNVSPLSYTLDF